MTRKKNPRLTSGRVVRVAFDLDGDDYDTLMDLSGDGKGRSFGEVVGDALEEFSVAIARAGQEEAEELLGLCADCELGTLIREFPWMVHDALWKAHGAGNAVLCIGCFEARLGRKLCRTDFTEIMFDKARSPDSQWSRRLRDRLTRAPSA